MKELSKAYSPGENETTIYEKWEESGYFNPDNLNLPEDAKPYTIVLPPPNITDKLHLGHSSMLAIEDLLIRYHRMNGYRALWLPGTDHAAIATQNVVEKKLLKEEKKTRHDLGREKFLEKVWEFLDETQATILKQTRRMGASLDWSREAFTFDEQRQKAVATMFTDMYKEGVIYQGERIVNWCPRCHSTLADDEVEHQDQKTMFYTFRYWKDFPISISTTRPETKIGDTAVAVNPKDERYKKFIGQEFEGEFCGVPLKIKVIGDREVDMDFGTGALGVTPAHSMVDWKMAENNDLEIKKVIDEDGKIHDGFGEFSGLTAKEAGKLVVKKLKASDLLEKEEEIDNALSTCYRCDTAIEPLPSKQWFVSVDKKLERLGGKSLKEKAIEVAKNKEVSFIPNRFKKQYIDWMENLHDWCISRQIWFGHRIPVWYKNDEIYVGTEAPKNKYTKAILLHAWDSDPEAAFFPWLKQQLENAGLKVIVPKLPNAKNPDYEEWLSAFRKLDADENTLIIGRSLGSTLALAAAQEGIKIGKLVAVCTPLDNKSIPDFFTAIGEWKFDKIKQNIQEITIFHSSNDPYIPKSTSEKLSQELNAPLVEIKNADHFTGIQYQEILEACGIWAQDPDVLDTWFSSGMWTFSTLGWPDNFKDGKKIGDLAEFHPTQVLETGYEILTLWVSRMIMMSLFAVGEIPFEDVYLHGMVLDENGKKMSKSKGNGIDPIDVIEEFGTDAVRLSLLIGNTPGNNLRVGEEKIAGMRNLVNKLWNISRYIETTYQISEVEKSDLDTLPDDENLTLADRWILTKFNELTLKVTQDIQGYRFSEAGEKLKEFTWNDLADWYLEISKTENNSEEKTAILQFVLGNLLKLWHPFIPFVTEKLWQELFTSDFLMISSWPKIDSDKQTGETLKNFSLLQNVITAIRNIRTQYKIAPKQKIEVVIYAHDKLSFLEKQTELISNLKTGIDKITMQESGDKISRAHYEIIDEMEIYVPLQDIIDIPTELKRLEEEIKSTENFIADISKKLDNKSFVENAPEAVVNKEKEKLTTQENKLKNLKKYFENIS